MVVGPLTHAHKQMHKHTFKQTHKHTRWVHFFCRPPTNSRSIIPSFILLFIQQSYRFPLNLTVRQISASHVNNPPLVHLIRADYFIPLSPPVFPFLFFPSADGQGPTLLFRQSEPLLVLSAFGPGVIPYLTLSTPTSITGDMKALWFLRLSNKRLLSSLVAF